MTKKITTSIAIGIILILAIIIGGFAWLNNQPKFGPGGMPKDEFNKRTCDYNNPNKKYLYKSLDECSRAYLRCEEEQKIFSDDCGCGCEIKNEKINISNWQTYRNENLGIEFKYPIQFSVEYVADSNVNKQIIQIRDYEAMVSHDIEILENPSRLTSKQYVEKILEDARKEYEGNEGKMPKPYLLGYKEKRELTIASLPAYELYGVFAYDQNEELVYLAKDNLVYFFNFPVAEENPNLPNAIEINKIAHQILSTFRFIE